VIQALLRHFRQTYVLPVLIEADRNVCSTH